MGMEWSICCTPPMVSECGLLTERSFGISRRACPVSKRELDQHRLGGSLVSWHRSVRHAGSLSCTWTVITQESAYGKHVKIQFMLGRTNSDVRKNLLRRDLSA